MDELEMIEELEEELIEIDFEFIDDGETDNEIDDSEEIVLTNLSFEEEPEFDVEHSKNIDEDESASYDQSSEYGKFDKQEKKQTDLFIAVDRELRVTKATDKKVVEGQLELF